VIKRIVLSGSGMVGKMLFKELQKRGYEITIVTRDIESVKKSCPNATNYILWDETQLDKSIDGAYGVINLAGAPIAGRKWTKEYKNTLTESRIRTTRQIVSSINKSRVKPVVLINASAIGYYGTRNTKKIFDENDNAGSDFLAKLCEAWENEANNAKKSKVRVVTIRSAIILDKIEGSLPKILSPFKYFIGGPIGNGRQPFSWIHIDDEIGVILLALENPKINGAINVSSPQQISNKFFANSIGTILNRPSFLPVPSFVLSLLYGEGAQVLTTGVNVSSKKIEGLGYKFKFGDILTALKDLLK